MPSDMQTSPLLFVIRSAGGARQSVEGILAASGRRIQPYDSAQDFLCRSHPFVPSCLVLDIMLVDMCGLELQARLAETRPDIAIVFAAAGADVAVGVRAMKAGAVDFLTIPLEAQEVLRAVDYALAQSGDRLSRDAGLQTLQAHYGSLSRREREVMALVTSGLLNKQVAGELRISEITVKAHRGNVMRKMQACTFAELVKQADRLSLAAHNQRAFRNSPLVAGLAVETIGTPSLQPMHARDAPHFRARVQRGSELALR